MNKNIQFWIRLFYTLNFFKKQPIRSFEKMDLYSFFLNWIHRVYSIVYFHCFNIFLNSQEEISERIILIIINEMQIPMQ